MLVPAKMQKVLIQEKRIMFNFKTHRNQAYPMCHVSTLVGNPKTNLVNHWVFQPPQTVRISEVLVSRIERIEGPKMVRNVGLVLLWVKVDP